jgi:CheY-like chemotaxis protein
MPSSKSKSKPDLTLLLAEDDVIIRLVLADHLRECGLCVIEAASAEEAKTILTAGAKIDFMLADAELAGPVNGFALAQWVRRNRPGVAVVLSAGAHNKAEAAYDMCRRTAKKDGHGEPASLRDRIASLTAERDRRLRKSSTAAVRARRLRGDKRSSN